MSARSGTFLTFQWNAVMDGSREGQIEYLKLNHSRLHALLALRALLGFPSRL